MLDLKMRGGYCEYDMNLADPLLAHAIRTYRPGIFRWFCSIDRHWRDPRKPPDLSRYIDAFNAMAEVNCKLVVQFQMKASNWIGNDFSGDRGCAWAVAGGQYGWWRDPTDFMAFLDSVKAQIPLGVIWGSWNEPHWRKSLFDLSRESPVLPWAQGSFFGIPIVPQHAFGYSGGSARLQQYHSMRPDWNWNTNGVGTEYVRWLDAVAQDPNLKYIDIHIYRKTPAEYVQYVLGVVREYDARRNDRLPVFVGEGGPDANGNVPWTAARAADLRGACAQLEAALGNRWLGWALHCQGSSYTLEGLQAGAPPAWKLEEPLARWWAE